MLESALQYSLMITAIYFSCFDGNIFSPVREMLATGLDKIFGKVASKYIQKPLWDCLPCMASVWTIFLSFSLDFQMILLVCGFNILIDQFVKHPDNERIADS